MLITLRHSYSAMQKEHPDHYEEWRAALTIHAYRAKHDEVSAAFTSLFLEQLWSHQEELHDILHTSTVMSLHIVTEQHRSAKFLLSIKAYLADDTPSGAFLETEHVKTPARTLPRAADFSKACAQLKEQVRYS